MNSVVTVFNLIVHRVTVVTSFSLCSCLTRVYLAGRLPKLKLTLSLNRAALAKGKLIKQKKIQAVCKDTITQQASLTKLKRSFRGICPKMLEVPKNRES